MSTRESHSNTATWSSLGIQQIATGTLTAIPQSRNPAIPQSRNPAIPQSRNPAIPQSRNIKITYLKRFSKNL
jgi:hypothetical protein